MTVIFIIYLVLFGIGGRKVWEVTQQATEKKLITLKYNITIKTHTTQKS